MLTDTLTTSFDPISTKQVEDFVRKCYAMTLRAWSLPSERDQQFALGDEGGPRYVLKISHPSESTDAIEMQTQALRHILNVDPTFPVPRPIQDESGRYVSQQEWSKHGPCCTRLMSYLEGVLVTSVPRSIIQSRHMGRTLGRLSRALRSFSHRADARHLNWDLNNAHEVIPLLDELGKERSYNLAKQALIRFGHEIRPMLKGLRRQVVHNDFHEHNVLVSAASPVEVAGVLDFGDLIRTQLINDVAIGASYLVCKGDLSLPFAVEFVAGFEELMPLGPIERNVLADLMAARLAMTVGITRWRARRFPAKAVYIEKNLASAIQGLEVLHQLSSKTRAQAFNQGELQ